MFGDVSKMSIELHPCSPSGTPTEPRSLYRRRSPRPPSSCLPPRVYRPLIPRPGDAFSDMTCGIGKTRKIEPTKNFLILEVTTLVQQDFAWK